MTRRPAVTVIEALMAILVMAIGLLALLTLFPLGAVSMYQSIKDERCAELSINATGQYKAFGINNDPAVVIASPSGTGTIFEDPWPLLTAGAPGVPSLITAGYTGPTYPVWIDPWGQYNGLWYVTTSTGTGANSVRAGTNAALVGAPWPTAGGISQSIPRATVSVIPSPPGTPAPWAWQVRWFTLQDDIAYLDNGTPDLIPGSNLVQREGRYSFSYVVRRPAPGITGPLDLTVVVYTGRSTGTDVNNKPLGETTYGDSTGTTGTVAWGAKWDTVTSTYQAEPSTVTINWTGVPTKPAIRRGNWILDARMVVDPTAATLVPAPQGYFYRVVSVTDVGNNLMEVVVQRPLGGQIRAPIGINGPPGSPPYQGPLVVVDNVAEVFEKGTVY
jgi:hypothetical protein